MSSSQLTFIFFRGVGIPPTSTDRLKNLLSNGFFSLNLTASYPRMFLFDLRKKIGILGAGLMGFLGLKLSTELGKLGKCGTLW